MRATPTTGTCRRAWAVQTLQRAKSPSPDLISRSTSFGSPEWLDRLRRHGMQGLTAIRSIAAGPVSYVLGGLAAVLGRYGEADIYFARSAAFCNRVGANFFAAATDLNWGRMLVEREDPGDAIKARSLLIRARDAAIEHGYAMVERRATAALTSARDHSRIDGRPPYRDPGSRGGLEAGGRSCSAP